MRYKCEAFEKFRNEVEKQLRRSIKSLRSNRGGEYLSQEFLDYLRDNGILFQWTPPYTPQHNNVVERRNRTLLDMVRSMMGKADLPKSFWGYALESIVFILNRVISKSVDVIPYEIWITKKPYLSHKKVWGSVKRTMLDKIEAKSYKCLFVGYHKETIVSKHAIF